MITLKERYGLAKANLKDIEKQLGVQEKTWTDKETMLEWKTGEVLEMNWQEAIKYAESLGDGWRLPTRKELCALIEDRTCSPTINTFIFSKCACSDCWTSTTYASYTNYAWHVDFNSGFVGYTDKTNSCYVWCVRNCKKESK